MKDDKGKTPDTTNPENYSPEKTDISNKINLGNLKAQEQHADRIVIRISKNIPPPPRDTKVVSLDTAIKAATGHAVKFGSSEKIVQEAARELWRRGTDPNKLESAVRSSSATLNERDKTDLLNIVGEIRKLNKAYPETSKKFSSFTATKDSVEVKNLLQGETTRTENAAVLKRTELGLQAERNENEYYSSDYVNESQNYLDNLSDYASNFSDQPEVEDYEEPEISPPSIQTQTTSTQPSEPSGTGIKNVLSRGRSAVTDSGKRVISNATNAVRRSAEKAVKQGLSKIASSAAPALAQAGLYIGAAVGIIMGILGLLATLIITVIIWTIGFIIFVAVILFIINSGAYIIPPGENLTTQPPSIGDYQCKDVENPECPCGWPVLPYESEGKLDIYQGSRTSGGTHDMIEAIDIIHVPEVSLEIGHPVTSRVSGTVSRTWSEFTIPYWGPTYGNGIEIESSCNGTTVTLRYGHNSVITVLPGQHVEMNEQIALSGDSGMGGPHVHYEFTNQSGIQMEPIFIPKYVPRGCNSYSGIPSLFCNVQIP